MPSCAVITCKARSQVTSVAVDGISFHRFPKDPIMKLKWIDATGRRNWFPTRLGTICSQHFDPGCFIKKKVGHTYLRHDAVPTLDIVILHEVGPSTNKIHREKDDVNSTLLGKVQGGHSTTGIKSRKADVNAINGINSTFLGNAHLGPSTTEIKREKDDVNSTLLGNRSESPMVCVKTELEDDGINTPNLTIYYNEAAPLLSLDNQKVDNAPQCQNAPVYKEAAPLLSLDNQKVDNAPQCQNAPVFIEAAPLLSLANQKVDNAPQCQNAPVYKEAAPPLTLNNNQNINNVPQCHHILVYNEAVPLLIFNNQNINNAPQQTTNQCQNAAKDNATQTVKCIDKDSYRRKKNLISIIKSQRVKIQKALRQNRRLRAKIQKLEEALKEKEKNT